MKDKIKEKLPGHRDDQHLQGTTTTTTGAYGYGQEGPQPEKKGMMEKIKEKMPGHH